ncbi:MAG: 2Fe-2S iron-sulfur cluster-binding protein, partial [Bacillota bacterium]|nr:2Fe-2S iron-sulfur cluster-binding protein [Bacillota bacterium]
MDYTVKIHIKNGLEYKTVPEGQNLLKFLNDNSYILKTPCGGNGTCGKCRIKVSGLLDKPTEAEKKLLGVEQVEKGYRLACYCHINSNIEIYPEDKQEEAKIITYGRQRKVKLNPLVSKKFIPLKQPDISDQNADEDRITAALDGLYLDSNIRLLGKLTKTLKHDDYKVTLFCEGKKIIDVESGDTTGNLFGLAVDIGTTTVAAYLFDLVLGERTDVFSVLNPQRKYGADVISRIDYTMKSADSLSDMNKTIIDCINNVISVLSQRNNIKNTSIYEAAFAGNTTMLHFLMNLPAAGIAVSPFIPVTTGPHTFKAIDLSIDINPKG